MEFTGRNYSSNIRNYKYILLLGSRDAAMLDLQILKGLSVKLKFVMIKPQRKLAWCVSGNCFSMGGKYEKKKEKR